MKKLFGKLNIKWWHVIVFAAVCGVYTGVMAMLPFLKDTSFQDITMTFECWILFAIILIVNGKTPLDSATKTFVFFLVSQPLVYLVQVPFRPEGFGLFRYYPPWFLWTCLTFPMAFAGFYMKKNKWYSLLILAPMMAFLGYHFKTFFGAAATDFPHHLLSAVFCAATMLIYPLCIFENKKLRMIGAALGAVILLAAAVWGVAQPPARGYEPRLLSSGSVSSGVNFDETYTVALEDESLGTVRIEYEENIGAFMVYGAFQNSGETRMTLTAPDGTVTAYRLTVDVSRSSYTIERLE